MHLSFDVTKVYGSYDVTTTFLLFLSRIFLFETQNIANIIRQMLLLLLRLLDIGLSLCFPQTSTTSTAPRRHNTVAAPLSLSSQ